MNCDDESSLTSKSWTSCIGASSPKKSGGEKEGYYKPHLLRQNQSNQTQIYLYIYIYINYINIITGRLDYVPQTTSMSWDDIIAWTFRLCDATGKINSATAPAPGGGAEWAPISGK